jgi:hypothetical protein
MMARISWIAPLAVFAPLAVLLSGIGVFLLGASVLAQQSTNFKISDHTFNAGGHPDAGAVLTSATYRITFDVIGDGTVGSNLSSTSFRMGGSFAACYAPPGEVPGLSFTGPGTLVWQLEPSAIRYNLYRDLVSNVVGSGYGSCEQYDLPDGTTTDTDPVPAGDGFFYLVTADNRLDEEGTKGRASDGSERPNSASCP